MKILGIVILVLSISSSLALGEEKELSLGASWPKEVKKTDLFIGFAGGADSAVTLSENVNKTISHGGKKLDKPKLYALKVIVGEKEFLCDLPLKHKGMATCSPVRVERFAVRKDIEFILRSDKKGFGYGFKVHFK